MARRWVEGDWAGFTAVIKRGLLSTLAASIVVTVVTYAVGVPILGLIFGQDVSGLRLELMVLVAGGAMNSAGVILYYALTTMRRQKLVFVGYVVAAGAITVLCLVLVPAHGLLRASVVLRWKSVV